MFYIFKEKVTMELTKTHTKMLQGLSHCLWFGFTLVLFKNFVFGAKYPILIFIFMISLCVMVSIVLKVIDKPLQKLIVDL